jgi:hypothetical protein
MQPSHEQPSAPYAGTRTEDPFGTWAHPTYESPPPGPMVTRGRPWIVALIAFLTLLVLIAALGNQWVTDSIRRHANGDTFIDHIVTAITTYQWRFTPRGGHDVARVWVSDFALIGTVLVLTFVLVGTVCRGKGGFAQAFFASWMTVLAGTLIGGYVKAAVIDRSLLLRSITHDTGNAIFFSPLSPGTSEIVGGLEFGFVVAVVAGVAAVLARRREPLAGAAPVAEPTPYPTGAAPYAAPVPYATPAQSPEHYGEPQPVPAPVPVSPWSYDDRSKAEQQHEHTAVLPPVEQPRSEGESEPEATTQLPRTESNAAERSRTDGESEAEATTQLPHTEPDAPEQPDAEGTTELPRTEPDAEGTTELPRAEADAPEQPRAESDAAAESPRGAPATDAPDDSQQTAELPRTESQSAPDGESATGPERDNPGARSNGD